MSGKASPADRLDPRSKLAIFVVACICVFSGLSLSQEIALLSLCGTALLLCGKYRKAFAFCLLYALLLFGDQLVRPQLSGILGNLAMMLFHVVRFLLPLFAAFCLVTRTTRIGAYISAFMAMRLPGEVIIPLAVMFRFVPAIQEEWQAVNRALRLRGLAFTWKNVLKRPLRMLEFLLVPFLLQCSVIVDEMSAAVMARGFDKEHPRTSYTEVRMSALDWCILAASAGFFLWSLLF